MFRFAVFLGALGALQLHAETLDEYKIKAAFLYNFAKFVEWPQQTFRSSSDPIAICVLGRNPFGSALADTVNGKVATGRLVVVHLVADAQEAGGCQILFVSSSERKRLRSVVGDLRGHGVLTVGETDGFTSEGGIVNFKTQSGAVRLEINVEAAAQERLQISSKLLSLAQITKK